MTLPMWLMVPAGTITAYFGVQYFRTAFTNGKKQSQEEP